MAAATTSSMSILLYHNAVHVHSNSIPKFQSSNKRHFASSSPDDWRKQQLQTLEQKFHKTHNNNVNFVDSDEALQPVWKEMESRVTRRKPRLVQQPGGEQRQPTGRINIRQTDEDIWAQEGMYDQKQQQQELPSTTTKLEEG
jgi:hypothetical protein